MGSGSIVQLRPGSGWNPGADGMPEVSIQTLLRVQSGTVTGQVEQPDLFFMLFSPFLHRPAVMHTQIVENQEYLVSLQRENRRVRPVVQTSEFRIMAA